MTPGGKILLNALYGVQNARPSPADQYRDKWRRESKKSLVDAVVAGEPRDEAVNRIHRRWHRTVPVAELHRLWAIAQDFAQRRQEIERMRDRMRPESLHERLSRMASPSAFVGPNGEIPPVDAHQQPYWHNFGQPKRPSEWLKGTADL